MVSGLSGLSGISAISQSLDDATVALIPRLTGSYSTLEIQKLDVFFRSLRSLGIINRFDALHLYQWGANANDACLNVLANNSATLVASPTFAKGVGVSTNGTSSYINPNINLASTTQYTQNTNSFGLWFPNGRATVNTGMDMGCTTGANFGCVLMYRWTGGLHRTRNNDSTAANSGGLTSTFVAGKMLASRRPNSNTIDLLRDGVKVATSSVASSALPSINMFVGALSNNNTATTFQTETYGADWIAASFSDTQYSGFYTAMNTLFS